MLFNGDGVGYKITLFSTCTQTLKCLDLTWYMPYIDDGIMLGYTRFILSITRVLYVVCYRNEILCCLDDANLGLTGNGLSFWLIGTTFSGNISYGSY